MNDRHPSGSATTPAPSSDAASALYASYGAREAAYDDFTSYDTQAQGYGANTQAAQEYATGVYATTGFPTDPLTGQFPTDTSGTAAYDYGTAGYDSVGYGASYGDPWSTGPQQVLGQDVYGGAQPAAQDTGSYDTTAWGVGHDVLSGIPAQPEQHAQADETQQWAWGAQTHDTGIHDATQWNSGGAYDSYDRGGYGQAAYGQDPYDRTAFEQGPYEQVAYDQPDQATHEQPDISSTGTGDLYASAPEEPPFLEGRDSQAGQANHEAWEPEDPQKHQEPRRPQEPKEDVVPLVSPRAASRSRRRSSGRRSALLTVAVPSVCVMGVAGVAAASVGGLNEGGDSTDTTASAPDGGQPVKPSAANSKLDTQLQSLSAGADDFADRASRTQERLDLKAEQEAERKKAAEEAARKERLRPKFVLPVDQHGLSAYFGQAGVNWMSVHTGIDFPVSYGTTVKAATDGTVRTQWNSSYGNMLILTAKDGTETWYCHLSTYQVSSGATVKAGDPIAFSGNSGNSTGPHLHFEVHPGGGDAVDPLPWLRSHGLDPT